MAGGVNVTNKLCECQAAFRDIFRSLFGLFVFLLYICYFTYLLSDILFCCACCCCCCQFIYLKLLLLPKIVKQHEAADNAASRLALRLNDRSGSSTVRLNTSSTPRQYYRPADLVSTIRFGRQLGQAEKEEEEKRNGKQERDRNESSKSRQAEICNVQNA